jgi:hypothetical protein
MRKNLEPTGHFKTNPVYMRAWAWRNGGQARWHCGRKHRFALIFFGTFLDQAKKVR